MINIAEATVFLMGINAVSFLMFGADKYFAIKNMWRISEKTLLSAAFVGGSLGALAGQKFFRHKTKKFNGLLPVLIVVQMLLLGLYFSGFMKVH
jgi:uncharacterized membrane protein YsdA (DUF1294 family)